MAQTIQYITMFNDASATTTVASFAQPTNAYPFLYTAGSYDATVTIYFEAVIKISTGTKTAQAALYTYVSGGGGAAVTGSTVTTTSTTAIRVRSGDIKANLVDGTEYCVQIGLLATAATETIYQARLVIIQTGTITKSEGQIEFGGTHDNYSDPGTSYIEAPNTGYFLYTAANWTAVTAIYFESTIEGDGTHTGYSQLYDTLGNAVSGSEVSSASGSRLRKRSGDIKANLVDGRTYLMRIKDSAAGGFIDHMSGRLIFVQSGSLTKLELHLPIRNSLHTITTTAGANEFGNILWNNSDISVSSFLAYHDVTFKVSSALKEADVDLNDGTTDLDTRSTSSTSKVQSRSGSITLSDGATYDTQLRITATAATATLYNSKVVLVVNLAAVVNTWAFFLYFPLAK